MMPTTDAGPIAVDRPDDIRRAREALDRAGFDDRSIVERLGLSGSADLSFGPADRPRVERRTRDRGPISTLIRLFLVGGPVDLDDFRRAVGPTDPALWVDLGLVAIEGDSVRRLLGLRPSEGLVIAHDFPLPDGSTRPDHVLGVTGSSTTFARTMIRVPAGRTLDLGTGGGYLAILAASHSEHVLGTDLNDRAVAIARFNMILNGIANVEVAEGDLFRPAGDRKFDLIFSNPPFVVSPGDGLIYRDSGMVGDEICERIIRGAPAHLAEGGFAQILCNWVRPRGIDWLERLVGWLDGSGCDARIIHNKSVHPTEYAQHWLGQATPIASGQFASRFDRWMDYYDRQGIEAIDYGLITLRRRDAARNWIQVDVDRGLNHPNGTGIAVGFAARDLIGSLPDPRSWLALRLRCRPELRLSQRLEPSDSGWKVDGAECVLGEGLKFEGEVDPAVFHLLTLCRGREPLGEVLGQVAARLGQDLETIVPLGLDAARSLVEQGFLWPVDRPLGLPAAGTLGTHKVEHHVGG